MVAAPPVGFNLTFVCPDGQVIVHYSDIESSPDLLAVKFCSLKTMIPILGIRTS